MSRFAVSGIVAAALAAGACASSPTEPTSVAKAVAGVDGPAQGSGTEKIDAASASLVGTTWTLVSLDGRPALPEARITAVFDDKGRVSGSAGCNLYTGSYRTAGDSLSFGLFASTRKYCGEGGVMGQEDAFLQALAATDAHRVAGGTLTLTGASHRLVFATS